MIVYVAADAATGKVISVHHAVDADGRDVSCAPDEVLATLPPHVDREATMVVPMTVDAIPSGRAATIDVDVQARTARLRPVEQAG